MPVKPKARVPRNLAEAGTPTRSQSRSRIRKKRQNNLNLPRRKIQSHHRLNLPPSKPSSQTTTLHQSLKGLYSGLQGISRRMTARRRTLLLRNRVIPINNGATLLHSTVRRSILAINRRIRPPAVNQTPTQATIAILRLNQTPEAHNATD